MQQVAFRIPDEHHEELQAYMDEKDVSLSEAGREYIRRGVEYDRLQTENNRLSNEKETAIQKYQGDRTDELDTYREYVRKQIEKEDATWWTRQKWRFFGRGDG